MKILQFAVVCAATLLPGLTRAADAPGAQMLGSADALVQFCSRVDPSKRGEFERQVAASLGLRDLPAHIAEAARRDPLYQRSFNLFESVLNELTVPDAKRACANLIAHDHHDPDFGRRPDRSGKDD
jgi:hypothetical protein